MVTSMTVGIPSLSFRLVGNWREGSRLGVTGEADVDGAVKASGCWQTASGNAAVTCSELFPPFTAAMMILAYHHSVISRSTDLVMEEFSEPHEVATPGADYARVIRWTSRRMVGEFAGVCRAAYFAASSADRHFDILILQQADADVGMIERILETVAISRDIAK